MKKSFLIALGVAAGFAFTACQPEIIDGPEPYASVSATDLANGISFTQYSDPEYTTPAADGNYIKFVSTAGIVQLYNYNKDGSQNTLATGAAGQFSIIPKRGNPSQQPIYGRLANADGTMTEWEGSVNVYVPADLDPEIKILVSESGVKKWIWDYNSTTGATCWGNGGASSGSDYDNARTVGGHWWGVATPEDLEQQLQHTGGSTPTGAEDSNAYMIFTEDNEITSYKADGSVIYSSTWNIADYDPSRASGWSVATLETKDASLLFPFSINEGGKFVTKFDVMYMDPNHMTLVYTKGNAPGSWAEITHWMFKNADDLEGTLNAYDSRKWSWATDGYEVWGNAGNTGNGDAFTWNNVDGKWWGVTNGEGLTGQLSHSDTGVATGEESNDAYMIFDKDGNVNCYDAAGNKIRGGSYEIEKYESRQDGWALGKLKTSSILFPFSINEGGVIPSEFDVMYFDGDNMTLVYTKGNGSGSWGEITYWRFEAKE